MASYLVRVPLVPSYIPSLPARWGIFVLRQRAQHIRHRAPKHSRRESALEIGPTAPTGKMASFQLHLLLLPAYRRSQVLASWARCSLNGTSNHQSWKSILIASDQFTCSSRCLACPSALTRAQPVRLAFRGSSRLPYRHRPYRMVLSDLI